MIFSKGFVFRMGQRVKDCGERMARIPVLRLFCGSVIGWGNRIRVSVLGSPIGDM